MNAECARPTCEQPARVLLAFDPRTARAWLRDLDNGDPSMGLLLCTEHAESTSVPVSWEIVDERRTVPEFSSEIYDSEPSFDDIFPPRAGYSTWDNLAYNEAARPATEPRHDPTGGPRRGDDGGRFAPRNEADDLAYSDVGNAALAPLELPEPDGYGQHFGDVEVTPSNGGEIVGLDPSHSSLFADPITAPLVDLDAVTIEEADALDDSAADEGGDAGVAPISTYETERDRSSARGAWYDTDTGKQPDWLERAESLDFGLDDYYDPYLDDPELNDEPVASVAVPVVTDPAPSGPSVAPLVRPGSPNEQVSATELLAAASVEPPQPIAARPSRPPVRDPHAYKDAVRLPERADLATPDAKQTTDSSDDGVDDLAASGTDGAPFPPHPGARTTGD